MTRKEMIQVLLMEECNELSQRVSKALRFGMEEKQPEQPFTNCERIIEEYIDLVATFKLLQAEGVIPYITDLQMEDGILNKQIKIQKYLRYSKNCGTLIEDQSAEIERLQGVLVAGAEYIQENWEKLTDTEGYGPQNLFMRMKGTMAGSYPGYSPGDFTKLQRELEKTQILLKTEQQRDPANERTGRA